VDWDRYIDSESPGLFLNHACDPNVGLRDSHCLVALRPLPAHCQIFMDYSTELCERNWTMRCLCASPRCRGLVIDFDLLPHSLRTRRLRQGIVQPYIVRQLDRLAGLSARPRPAVVRLNLARTSA
jgi:hypothetical protein